MEIQQLKTKKEVMWKQRSRNAWLKEGDSNTKYFHCQANQRNRRNHILGLEDENGVWIEEEAAMGKVVEWYFEGIFTSSNPSSFEEILDGVLHTVIAEDNVGVASDFHANKVFQALKQMAPLTAPGPDGMSHIFYKSFWHIVGKDVTEVVLNALNSSIIPESLNTIYIALIPKIKDLKKVADFRPISLCNVIYKLIAKVVANHLKKFLIPTIPNSQSAFLSGHLIYDNILVAFETLHYLKRKTTGKLGYMALKLDMSKAYDRVEWEFLEKIMHHLGLDEKLIQIIMSCMKMVSYSVLLNGQPMGSIKPSKGLRQGDPLSPYVFLLCALGLQSLLQKAEANDDIKGVAICRNGPRVSHLFFVDDSVLFCRATEAGCRRILDVLAVYERGSWQKINREKTNIFFSSNT